MIDCRTRVALNYKLKQRPLGVNFFFGLMCLTASVSLGVVTTRGNVFQMKCAAEAGEVVVEVCGGPQHFTLGFPFICLPSVIKLL